MNGVFVVFVEDLVEFGVSFYEFSVFVEDSACGEEEGFVVRRYGEVWSDEDLAGFCGGFRGEDGGGLSIEEAEEDVFLVGDGVGLDGVGEFDPCSGGGSEAIERVELFGESLYDDGVLADARVFFGGIVDASSGEGRGIFDGEAVVREESGREVRGHAGEGAGELGGLRFFVGACGKHPERQDEAEAFFELHLETPSRAILRLVVGQCSRFPRFGKAGPGRRHCGGLAGAGCGGWLRIMWCDVGGGLKVVFGSVIRQLERVSVFEERVVLGG